jgi:hypothetical protein
MEIEQSCEERREERYDERNYLYEIFLKYQKDVKIVFSYANYISDDGVSINFDLWIAENSNHAKILNEVKEIQPHLTRDV